MTNTVKENQTKELVTISNVHGYVDENGTVWLNVEDVARGLGFVMIRKERVTISGDSYEAVRWDRVNGYLAEFDYPNKVTKNDFLPENMFYLLAMKANNEAAKTFQLKVANEILPAIRKTGFYSVKPMTATQMFVAAARALEEQEQRISAVEDSLVSVNSSVSVLTDSMADINKRLDHEAAVNAFIDHSLDIKDKQQQVQLDRHEADIEQLRNDNFVVKEDISTDIKGFVNLVFNHYPQYRKQGQRKGKQEVYQIFYGAVSEAAGYSSTHIATLISERRRRLISQGLSESTVKTRITGIPVINSDLKLRTAAMGIIKNIEDIIAAEVEEDA